MGERIRLMVADGATHKVTARVRGAPDARQFELVVPADGSEAAQLAVAPAVDAIFAYQAVNFSLGYLKADVI